MRKSEIIRALINIEKKISFICWFQFFLKLFSTPNYNTKHFADVADDRGNGTDELNYEPVRVWTNFFFLVWAIQSCYSVSAKKYFDILIFPTSNNILNIPCCYVCSFNWFNWSICMKMYVIINVESGMNISIVKRPQILIIYYRTKFLI